MEQPTYKMNRGAILAQGERPYEDSNSAVKTRRQQEDQRIRHQAQALGEHWLGKQQHSNQSNGTRKSRHAYGPWQPPPAK
ncbi:hypothetical protein Q6332_29135, partial [Klebsiella pneumoniae]|uniref:hypothetical protein n=1 Tax=Klebsiella pneumoniae TaxID=573 RepID=UPI002731B6BA